MRRPVLLYDGTCGLCQRLVRALLRSDRAGRLNYAALQSAPAQQYLRTQGLPLGDFDSLVFVPDWNQPPHGGYLLRTDGALAACREAGGAWGLMGGLRHVPAAWRDPVYRLVARIRFALFGASRPELLDRPEWAGRFLDR